MMLDWSVSAEQITLAITAVYLAILLFGALKHGFIPRAFQADIRKKDQTGRYWLNIFLLFTTLAGIFWLLLGPLFSMHFFE